MQLVKSNMQDVALMKCPTIPEKIREIKDAFGNLLCSNKPIFDIVTTWQQGNWCITANISKTRISNSVVQNCVLKVDHTL